MTSPANQNIVIDQIGVFVKRVFVQFAQLLDVQLLVQALNGFFTLFNAFVILGASQRVLLVGTHDHDFVVAQLQWQVLIFQSTAVQKDGVVFLTHPNGKLVHNSGVQADKIVFRLLTKLNQRDFVNIQIEFILQQITHQKLNGS